MMSTTRKRFWPLSLAATLVVIALLAGIVSLAVVPNATRAQAPPPPPALPGAPAASPTPTATATPAATQPPAATPAPTADPNAPPPPPALPATPTPAATAEPTATPVPTATPEPADPTPTPDPTATPVPASTPADDEIDDSSSSASVGVKLTLTIGNLPRDMEAGSSIELYLEDDFDVPDSIDKGSVYFTVTNPRGPETNSGGRVYVTDAVEIDTDDHYGGDDDWAIQVFLPDFNTGDDFDGFQGPMKDQTLQLVILKSGGIKNPSEEGSHSVGYSVLDPNADANDGPQTQLGTVGTVAKISLSDEDNTRGYTMTVTGSGFNNGTSAAVHVLADADVTQDLAAMVAAGGDLEAQACSLILTRGQRAGIATVGSDDKVAVEFEVTVPIFKPGAQNFICMVDGEGRSSRTDVEQFELEPSIRVSPANASVGDTVNIHAQDFPNPGASLTSVEIANQIVWPRRAVDPRFPGNYVSSLDPANIGNDGSATVTFDLPGSVSDSALEGTIRIDAQWGGTVSSSTATSGGTPDGGTSEDAKITLTGSTLRLSAGEARANESVTIQGEGFGSGGGHVCADNITIDGVSLELDDDAIVTRPGCGPDDNNGNPTPGPAVEVSNAGQFVATVYLWGVTDDERDTNNPALIAGTHTIKVQDSAGFYGTATVIIKEPGMTITPDVLGPRDNLTVTGTDWPVDNLDSDADIGNVVVKVEEREYTVIPDGTGRFTVEHKVSRRVAIPSTQQVEATYREGNTRHIVKTESFEVPAASIEIDPGEGQPGDEVSLTVTGMPVYTEVEEITIGGASVGGARDFRTDKDGNLTAEDLPIPGLDPGTYSVIMKVGSGDSQTVAIGSVNVLLEEAPGAKAMLPAALENLEDNLVAVFYFDNVSKEWSFYDPRPEFEDLNTLSELITGQAYWILVEEAVDEVVLNNKPYSLTCSDDDCWNLKVW